LHGGTGILSANHPEIKTLRKPEKTGLVGMEKEVTGRNLRRGTIAFVRRNCQKGEATQTPKEAMRKRERIIGLFPRQPSRALEPGSDQRE